ncbi:hypothetical protein [Streptosporangium sp. NPDC051022]|uniref:hypothetical protein n=1 Tax=Streptosporangium sp. NPDC051022 TaxID=3155752 RepID=UPI00344191EE
MFNVTDRVLEFPSEGIDKAWPPFVEMFGVRVYFIVIRAYPPQATASKLGKASPSVITRDDLVNPDAD